MRKPRVFIGCSSQGLEIAEAVQRNLNRDHDVSFWNQGLFGLGRSVLDHLLEIVGAMDYAVFVLRADDVQVVVGDPKSPKSTEDRALPVARANVVFELGMAIGRIGPSRTFMVYDTHDKPAVISDLAGVIWTGYDGSLTKDLFRSVAMACTEIRSEINKRQEGAVWYTEWQMGSKRNVERLRLTIEAEIHSGQHPVRRVVGVREYDEVNGGSNAFSETYKVTGTEAAGLYWLEYHALDGMGDGTIFLAPSGGKMHGIISSGHCDKTVMRAYSNGWIPARHAERYNPSWLVELAVIPPDLPETPGEHRDTQG